MKVSKDKLKKILNPKDYRIAVNMNKGEVLNLSGKKGEVYAISVLKEKPHPYNHDSQNFEFEVEFLKESTFKNYVPTFEEFIFENKGWKIGDTIKYKSMKTGKWRKGKIQKDLENGRWELESGAIAYEKDPDFIKENWDDYKGLWTNLPKWEQVSYFMAHAPKGYGFGIDKVLKTDREWYLDIWNSKTGNNPDLKTAQKLFDQMLKNIEKRFNYSVSKIKLEVDKKNEGGFKFKY